jgi:tetratricopeptide (TPR) repeat protein
VFASKANGPYTQLWLTHVDPDGTDSRPVVLEHFTAPDRAANIPEFLNAPPDRLVTIRQEFADDYTHFRVGLMHERLMQHAEAVAEFRKVIAEKPDHVQATYLIGSCLARMGREPQATPYVRRALKLDPTHLAARRLMGSLMTRQGRYKEAIATLEAVLKEAPRDAVTANNLAWVLATCPDAAWRNGARAVELAKQACMITLYRVPMMMDTLAAAYAEAGQFEKAVDMAQQVLDVIRAHPGVPTRDREFRLKLYKEGRAYREGVTRAELLRK